MLTEDELHQGKEQIVTYIENLGDTVEDVQDGQFEPGDLDIDSEYYFTIIATEASYDCTYVIFGRQGFDSFITRYDYNLIQALRNAIETEEGQEIFDLDAFSASDPVGAVEEIFERVDDNDLRRLRFQLHDHISNPITITRIVESEDNILRGFRVIRHLFPFEDSWTYSDFYDTITAVTSTGERGARYLANSFAIQIPEASPDEDLRFTFDPEEVF